MTLYHGTSQASAEALAGGEPIDLARANPNADFGPGFYMTTCLPQARRWASFRFGDTSGAVIAVRLRLARFADLRVRAFAMTWKQDHNQFWQLVRWCRLGYLPQEGQTDNEPIDAIIGPVAKLPIERRIAHPAMDQVCFATEDALKHTNQRFFDVGSRE
jgi:hypothetical protein